MSEVEPHHDAAPSEAGGRPTEERPPSTTIGAGTVFAIGCVVLMIVFVAAALLIVPRLR